jgi:hypothetical protein
VSTSLLLTGASILARVLKTVISFFTVGSIESRFTITGVIC